MVHSESQGVLGTAGRRSQLYALLAAGYQYPSDEDGAAVSNGQFQRQVSEALAGLPYPLPVPGTAAEPAALSPAALAEAYVHLFDVGSVAGPPCCLYEAEYGGGRMGVMEDLLRFYHFFGLRLSPEDRDRPDHLATELEFLHWLTFQEAQARATGIAAAAEAYRAATSDFLTAHASGLAGQIAGRISANGSPFYPDLARLAAEFCVRDLEYLQGPQAPSPSRIGGDGVQGMQLILRRLRQDGLSRQTYSREAFRAEPLKWDRVVKASHITNCWYQRACNLSLFVSDGVILREEQAANYPPPNDPDVPDLNPRGCQKGVCYTHRTYDSTRIKYPLKRAGARGEGRWQRISWDQALTEIADTMIDVLTTEGPQAIVQGAGTHIHSHESAGAGSNTFFEALGIPLPTLNHEIGDDHEGAAITFGKIMFSSSADQWFHADVILVWGGNPAYTHVPDYHYIAEARYKGARVIVITPDFNASAMHADLWVPVNVGTDAALALGLCQVIIQERLFKTEFVREQTDLPLLVRVDDGKFLREKDLKRGGRDDAFYLYDQASQQIVEAPRKSLALNGLVPALEGEYEIQTLAGRIRVRPAFEVLREKLNAEFTPDQVAQITGTPAAVIELLARDLGTTPGFANVTTANWGKFYHGTLIERALILVHALCGCVGRKGAAYSAFPALAPDVALGAYERQGKQKLLSAATVDPRYAGWVEDGYTMEMILREYGREAATSGAVGLSSLWLFFHGGILDLAKRHPGWDPHLKRPLGEYVDEALRKGWQTVVPRPEVEPRILFQWGGNVLRRSRATNQLIQTVLPKLKMLVTADTRMTGTALYSDYLLPACGYYERYATCLWGSPQSPFMQINDRATDPLYESQSDWTIFARLAQRLEERARERGVLSYLDGNGRERRLDRVVHAVTAGGIYDADDEEAVARDAYLNTGNVEHIEWEDVKQRGIAPYTGVGTAWRSITNACDIQAGEPIVPLSWHTEKKQIYPTLTRRIQFYLDQEWYMELEEHLPTHKDCPKAGGDYPLQVTSGHARWSIHSLWVDDTIMLALQRGEPAIYMSPEDAAARGIQDGDLVEARNDVGLCRVRVIVAPSVRQGQVIIYHSWENYQFEGWHHFKSIMPSPMNPIELVSGYGHIHFDPINYSPGLNDRGSRVEVTRVG